ncbi:MAG: hypothetical protein ACRCSG_07060 [Cellulosilyticaceae bacterium]
MIFDNIIFYKQKEMEKRIKELEKEIESLFENYREAWNELCDEINSENEIPALRKSIKRNSIYECLQEMDNATKILEETINNIGKQIKFETLLKDNNYNIQKLPTNFLAQIIKYNPIVLGSGIGILAALLLYKKFKYTVVEGGGIKNEIQNVFNMNISELVDAITTKISNTQNTGGNIYVWTEKDVENVNKIFIKKYAEIYNDILAKLENETNNIAKVVGNKITTIRGESIEKVKKLIGDECVHNAEEQYNIILNEIEQKKENLKIIKGNLDKELEMIGDNKEKQLIEDIRKAIKYIEDKNKQSGSKKSSGRKKSSGEKKIYTIIEDVKDVKYMENLLEDNISEYSDMGYKETGSEKYTANQIIIDNQLKDDTIGFIKQANELNHASDIKNIRTHYLNYGAEIGMKKVKSNNEINTMKEFKRSKTITYKIEKELKKIFQSLIEEGNLKIREGIDNHVVNIELKEKKLVYDTKRKEMIMNKNYEQYKKVTDKLSKMEDAGVILEKGKKTMKSINMILEKEKKIIKNVDNIYRQEIKIVVDEGNRVDIMKEVNNIKRLTLEKVQGLEKINFIVEREGTFIENFMLGVGACTMAVAITILIDGILGFIEQFVVNKEITKKLSQLNNLVLRLTNVMKKETIDIIKLIQNLRDGTIWLDEKNMILIEKNKTPKIVTVENIDK